ncbi:MAG: beta-propeller fold lactonase family protein [Bacteroidia bacterium]|nr:beta-propeller fold lactonase family protein [Bacteroidia bacterium]
MNLSPQWYLVALLVAVSACQPAPKTEPPMIQALRDSRLLLPNGWHLTPAGEHTPLGDLPLNMVVSPRGTWVAITHNGVGEQSVMLFEAATGQRRGMAVLRKAWLGLAFSEDEKTLYASGGNENLVWELAVVDTGLVLRDSLVMGKPLPAQNIWTGGVAVDQAGGRLFALGKEDSALYVFDLKARTVLKRIGLPAEPYTCLLSPDKARLYVSVWGARKVLVFDTPSLTQTGEIPTGSHPNDMVLTQDGTRLFVANANDNTVTVADTRTGKVQETLSAALYPGSLAGSTTNAVALSPDEKTLFIANADNNCLVLFDIHEVGQSRPQGFIPTGWYPTAVSWAGDRIWVTNGKGLSSKANPRGPSPYSRHEEGEDQYIGSLLKGALSRIEMPDPATLAGYAALTFENTPYQVAQARTAAGEAGNAIPQSVGAPSPIKYIFYIIKENRTYDQVLGDMPEGNGDPSLCLFPDSVTPNQHALSREFVLLDNFYVNAEVSADGHNWSTAAYANDYTEKTWPTSYGGRGGDYVYEGHREIAYPDAGFIWTQCKRAGLSYRSYGIFKWEDGIVRYPDLKGLVSVAFPPYNLEIADTTRVRIWKHEFDSLLAIGAMPRFQTIQLCRDHTAGEAPGLPTPAAMVADNDLAVGQLVAHISQSPIWKESAIFILEDDAQNGPDHVDAHRSIAFVVSPYTKRGAKVSELYTTCSMIRTMELILGLPPMNQHDAAALPMFACFQGTPDLTPYVVKPNRIPLDQPNPTGTALSRQSAGFNLSVPDAIPDLIFSEVVWKAVRGAHAEMPAPRRSAFLQFAEEEEEAAEVE